MRFDYFSILGYVSVLLWLAVPALWVLHSKMRPRKWLCHIALVVAVGALVLATINSTMYVDKIQLDMSKQMEEWQAEQAAKLKAAEESRMGEASTIRFAEDDPDDHLDRAGMDETDLMYIDKLNEDTVPEWQKQKKRRSQTKEDDTSLDALIGAKTETEGVEGSAVDDAAKEDPVIMVQKDMDLANKLDGINLKIIRILILLGIIYVVSDYLSRANSYQEAYLPLPVPSTLLNSMAPAKALFHMPTQQRRSMPEELAWVTGKGDSFVYMTDKPGAADMVPSSMPSLLNRFMPVDVIRVDGEIDDKFVFETLWYGRSSFVVDSSERAIQMLGQFVAYLTERKACRAKVGQTVHIVWDVTTPLSEEWQLDFARLTKATGISLVICPA